MEESKKLGENRLQGCGTRDVVAFTDGSATEGMWNGGSGVVITRGPFQDPVVVATLEQAAGRVSSSFQAELQALYCALEWLREHVEEWMSCAVVSDSMSALVALRGCRGGLCEGVLVRSAEVLTDLVMLGRRVAFVWAVSYTHLRAHET